MRTTLDIDDDVLGAARTLAAERGISLGSAMTELARRGLRAAVSTFEDDLPVFDVSADAPPLTPAMIERALDD
jgi:hypothetical protein